MTAADDVFPGRHVVRDLCTTTEQISATRSVCVTPLGGHLRDRAGAPSLAVMATVADVNASLVALTASAPDWTATVSLTLHASDAAIGDGSAVVRGPLVADARLERVGSKIVVVRTTVHDGAGRSADDILDGARTDEHLGTVLAAGIVTFARIPGSASRAAGRFDPTAMIGRRRTPAGAHQDDSVMMQQLVGWRVTDPASGIVEVDASPYVSNSFGAITGGVHAMVMQAAAEAASPTASVVGLELHYLAQAREGGVRTLIERRRSDLFEVQLVHRDADGRFVTLGTVTLRTSWADPPGI